MRKFRSIALGLALVVAMGLMPASAAPSKEIRIGFVLKTLMNPFWVDMKEGALAEAKKLGVVVDIYSVPTEGDIKAQAELVDNILQKGYDALALAPMSPVNLIPAVVRANKMGIPVINVDEAFDKAELAKQGAKVISFVTTNNVKVGAQAAEFVISKLGAAGGEVAIIEGMAGNVSGNDRRDGFRATMEKNSAFKIVASQPANWDRMMGLNVATNVLQRYPKIKAIYCCNDTMALGAAQAVVNAGKQGSVLVVGTDGIPEAIAAINEGRMTATVAQDPGEIGATSVRMLVEYLQGGAVPDKIDVASQLITK
jgi:D-allose transport system substrate-binding protein